MNADEVDLKHRSIPSNRGEFEAEGGDVVPAGVERGRTRRHLACFPATCARLTHLSALGTSSPGVLYVHYRAGEDLGIWE